MDASDLDLEALDAKVETERQRLVSRLRRIADRLEALSLEDVIEPVTILSEQTHTLIRRAETVLKVGSPPGQSR